jgi:hypothetical protein
MTAAFRVGCALVVIQLAGATPAARGQIADVQAFLEQCPTSDPAYAQIRQDFRLRRNGQVVGEVACTGPISAMPISQLSDEVIVLQGLRVLYYMDRGRSNHLPWTSGTLYDWMKSKLRGVDLSDTSGSWCCVTFEDGVYATINTQDDVQRNHDRGWRGISQNIALYTHEVRHRDGFVHDSGCGIAFGCDPTFDLANLSAYGIQWWLNKAWLEGTLSVGAACMAPADAQATAEWHLGSVEEYRRRFSSNAPPVVAMPAAPLGVCSRVPAGPGTPTDVQATVNGNTLTIAWSAPLAGTIPTGYRVEFFARGVLVLTMAPGVETFTSLTIPPGVQGAFTVTVTAVAGTNVGVPSVPAMFTIGSVPGMPTNLQAVLSGRQLTVSWSAPASGPTPTAYVLEFFADGVLVLSVPSGLEMASTLTIPASVHGTFIVTVSARNGAVVGARAVPATFTVPSGECTIAPLPPTGLTGSVLNGQATVSWIASPAATSYVVQAGSAAGLADLYDRSVGAATVVSANGLPSGFSAYVRVSAVNACGRSAPSALLLLR